MVEPRTAGDPMQEDLYWTHLSQEEIADLLWEMGTPVSQPTVGRLLDDLGFAKRQIEKTIAGGNVPLRNQQFEIIEALKNRYVEEKKPVFSIDTKKKERWERFIARAGHMARNRSRRLIMISPVGLRAKLCRTAFGIQFETTAI